MKLSYLVDSDWIIDHLNGVKEITHKLIEFERDGLAISIISVGELFEGAMYSRNPSRSLNSLETHLKGYSIVGLEKETAGIFGQERGKLRKTVMLIGDSDLWIAATCLFYGLTLLTNNRKHFTRIKGLNIISNQ